MRFNLLPLAAAVTLALNPFGIDGRRTTSKTEAQDRNIEKITVMGKYTVSRNIDTATGSGLHYEKRLRRSVS